MPNHNFIDITGEQYNYWTVLYRDCNNTPAGKSRWVCQCVCGTVRSITSNSLRSGQSKSCGCMAKTTAKDITNERFGRLVAIKPVYSNQNHNIVWLCQCDCGNTTELTASRLLTGGTRSCGCLQKDIVSSSYQDLTGQRFGKLVAIEKSGKGKYGLIWKCLCDCGNTIEVYRMNLKDGSTKSCGCMKSYGEQVITSYLTEHMINYKKEYCFDDCRNINPMPFDFYLPDIGEHGACIEFDGIQHYQESKIYSTTVPLNERIRRDQIKTKYCQDHNIRLLRIPYWEKDNIESILNDWLFSNDTKEVNSLDVNLSA